MYFPPIYEGEFLPGYRGRLATLNGCRTVAKLHAAVKATGMPFNANNVENGFGEKSRYCRVDFAGVAARALEQEVGDLLRRHTLLGLSSVLQTPAERRPADVSHDHTRVRRHRNGRVALCSSCVSKDLKNTHLSFWRRDHQLPGCFRCPEHGDLLRFVSCPPLLVFLPHEVITQACPADDAVVAYADNSVAARLTLALLWAVLNGAVIRTHVDTRHALLERAMAHVGINKIYATTVELSDRFRDQVPTAWISDLLPNIKWYERPLRFVSGVIQAMNMTAPVCAYALVAGHICSSFEEAVSVLGLQTHGSSLCSLSSLSSGELESMHA